MITYSQDAKNALLQNALYEDIAGKQYERYSNSIYDLDARQAELRRALMPDPLYMRPRDPLTQRAERNYPDSQYLQTEWLRAVKVVRSTTNGWVAERLVPRKDLS